MAFDNIVKPVGNRQHRLMQDHITRPTIHVSIMASLGIAANVCLDR